jgi:hypothetical protein
MGASAKIDMANLRDPIPTFPRRGKGQEFQTLYYRSVRQYACCWFQLPATFGHFLGQLFQTSCLSFQA